MMVTRNLFRNNDQIQAIKIYVKLCVVVKLLAHEHFKPCKLDQGPYFTLHLQNLAAFMTVMIWIPIYLNNSHTAMNQVARV